MKKYNWLILIFTVMICSCSTNAVDGKKKAILAEKSYSVNKSADSSFAKRPGVNFMLECGRGYVVGLWSNANQWNEWAVWLSPTGSWSGGKSKIYWEYSNLRTDNDSGRNAYATLLAAQASGQMVALLDDDYGSRCNEWGTGANRGPQFNSVQIWFP
ncbi:hypothetical protein J8V57_00330 [Xenorhabdus sp. PB61.4]|uniref:hypothetical protein n=1 Tax=Xenorhabdus sp. PB61.4 TaxID=2788940 RepID=UPI001E53DC8E|nr:hypothetical protein [Xenorhabdus sp. PB61.4]MCC8364738.1 hypothetical protein [Xenorhabdus sp. PB61.4]